MCGYRRRGPVLEEFDGPVDPGLGFCCFGFVGGAVKEVEAEAETGRYDEGLGWY